MPSGLYDTADIPAEALAIAEHFQGEWYNRGLSQFFANWEPADAAFVPAALRISAYRTVPKSWPRRSQRSGRRAHGAMPGHRAMLDSKLPIAEVLNDLNREMGELEKPFDDAIAAFERRLAEESGEEMFE